MVRDRGNDRLESSAERLCGRQRDVLGEVAKQNGACDLVRIARTLAARDKGHDPTPVRTRRIYTGLYNDHIDELVESGLVEYCDEEGVVRLTARGRALVTDGR